MYKVIMLIRNKNDAAVLPRVGVFLGHLAMVGVGRVRSADVTGVECWRRVWRLVPGGGGAWPARGGG